MNARMCTESVRDHKKIVVKAGDEEEYYVERFIG